MIVSDHHRFVFVHIPKCAGTLIRRCLEPFADTNDISANRAEAETHLGRVDPAHIPLFILKDYFQTDFRKLNDYWSFAVVRDPYSRFPSSVSQRLRKYGGERMRDLSLDEVRRAVDETITFLSRQPRHHHLLPNPYIHFQRQVDYLFLDGKQCVESIFNVRDLSLLFDRVRARVGEECWKKAKYNPDARVNKTVVYRSGLLRYILGVLRPVSGLIGQSLPYGLKQRLRTRLYVPVDRRFEHLFSAGHIQEFIGDYYAEDIAMVERLQESEPSPASGYVNKRSTTRTNE